MLLQTCRAREHMCLVQQCLNLVCAILRQPYGRYEEGAREKGASMDDVKAGFVHEPEQPLGKCYPDFVDRTNMSMLEEPRNWFCRLCTEHTLNPITEKQPLVRPPRPKLENFRPADSTWLAGFIGCKYALPIAYRDDMLEAQQHVFARSSIYSLLSSARVECILTSDELYR